MDRRVTHLSGLPYLHGVPHLFFGYEFPMRVIAKKKLLNEYFGVL